MLKTALIGYGYWGQRLLRYLEKQFDITYICHLRAKESGAFTPYLDKVLQSDVSSIVIATPIDTHYELAKRALQHGKHVLCEKPLAQTQREVEELIDLATNHKLSLVTEFTYTFSTGINKAKKLIDSDTIGSLMAMDLSLKYLGRFLAFNVHWLLSSHLLSIYNMFNPLENTIFYPIELIKDETMGIAIIGKVPATLNISLNYPQKETKIVWYGSCGTIVYDGINQPTLHITSYTKKYKVLSDKMINSTEAFNYDEKNNLRYAVSFFKDVLEGHISGKDNLVASLAVTKVLERLK